MSLNASQSSPAERRSGALRGASRYAAQRRRGFGQLVFSGELETEYREYRLPIMRRRLATLFHISGFGLFSYLLIDSMIAQPKLTPLGIGFVMSAISVVVLMVFVTRHSNRAQSLDTNVALGITAFGLCIVASVLAAGSKMPIGGVFVTVISIYFVAGIPTRKAALAALTVSFSYLIGTVVTDAVDAIFAYKVLFIVLLNVVGLFGEYQIEHEARRSFLLQMELRDLAQHDGLTHLLNRRAFRRQLQLMWRQAERDKKPVGLMLFDLDHLKRINDTLGHTAGDRCIKALSAILRRRVQRPLDLAGRLGGDEFGAAWFDVDLEWFAELAESIRAEAEAAAGEGSEVFPRFTISLGAIHLLPGHGVSVAEAVDYADLNLYEAKRHTRNRVVLSGQHPHRTKKSLTLLRRPGVANR